MDLISLDLKNFDISSIKNMLSNCNNKLIYCIIYNNAFNNNNLRDEINKSISINNNDVQIFIFINIKKIIFDNKTCALNCTDINKYDYNNILKEISFTSFLKMLGGKL